MQSFNMERNINGTSQYAVDAVAYNEHDGTYNNSYNELGDFQNYYLKISIIRGFILVICCMGFLGNGTVIWLLCFRIRRNPFTTYILNLAVADFALLLVLEYYPDFFVFDFSVLFHITVTLIAYTYNTGQLLLTAISIDRCLSVLFPIWHRCVRPTHLTTTICALIWAVSGLLCILPHLLKAIKIFSYDIANQFLLTGLLCLPLMTISTVILFIKVCFKSHPQKRGRLLTVILLTLLFFLMFAFPLNAILLALSIQFVDIPGGVYGGFLCASINSSVNPLLYFLVGRKKGGRSRESLAIILQRVLNEEENERQEVDPPSSNPLKNLP